MNKKYYVPRRIGEDLCYPMPPDPLSPDSRPVWGALAIIVDLH